MAAPKPVVAPKLSLGKKGGAAKLGSAAKRDYCVIRGFCTCMNYAFSVASKPEALLCKHELAAELADALDLALTSEYDDEEWAAKLEMFSRLDLESFMPKS